MAIPAVWAMSAIRMAPTESAICGSASQSGAQEYDVNPATMVLGRCSIASAWLAS